MKKNKKDLSQIAHEYSALYPGIDDLERRERKGRKVASIIEEARAGKPIGYLLDVGCSNAKLLDVVAERLNPRFAVGIDLDLRALPSPKDRRVAVLGSGMELPFRNESADVIVCNHTYEHVPDSERLMDELHRVLKRGGVVYLGAMNARWPIEPHYKVPFIHVMPRWMSGPILRRMGYPWGYLEKPLSLRKLRQLVSKFTIRDYTLSAIADPEKYFAQDVVSGVQRKTPVVFMARALYGFLPGYLWILEKR